MNTIRIAIADDQQLFLKSLSLMLETFDGIKVVAEALDGTALLPKIDLLRPLPDLVLIDVQMKEMGGAETVRHLSTAYPSIRCVALSLNAEDTTVIEMLKAGCCSYLLKDIHPAELEKSIRSVYTDGYCNGDLANLNSRRLILHAAQQESLIISEKEKTFLQLACSDRTYHQIAAEMHLSEKTIDGYRASLFEKLQVRSRVGLALEAIKLKLVRI